MRPSSITTSATAGAVPEPSNTDPPLSTTRVMRRPYGNVWSSPSSVRTTARDVSTTGRDDIGCSSRRRQRSMALSAASRSLPGVVPRRSHSAAPGWSSSRSISPSSSGAQRDEPAADGGDDLQLGELVC